MAAKVDETSRAENHEVSPLRTLSESNKEHSNLTNGKVYNQSNDHSKSKSISNGVTKYKEDLTDIDWSHYDSDYGTFEKSSLLTAILTHLGLYILMFLGFVNQLLFTPKVAREKNREGYAPLYNPFEQFFSRYVYRRVKHCFNQPICSAPAAQITLMERYSDDYNWTLKYTGRKVECLNMGSYNYLGLGATSPPEVAAAVRQYGLTMASSRAELGSTPLHQELEESVAKFLGVESAIVFGMGFATNTLSLPGLVGPDTLAFSDENNHASLILGLRLAGATVQVFRHNDVQHLAELARAARARRSHRRYIVVVEGVYSMEGSVAPLRALVALARRLGLRVYLDEAHSVGAVGARGRGVPDLCGVPPRSVDVLMGTFTKSFGAAGGYVAGSAALIRSLRARGHGHSYAASMSPAVAAQVLWALRTIDSPAGLQRVRRLRDNTAYFRDRLRALGVVMYGSRWSPVVPVLVYSFSKMAATVERLARAGVAVVGVGFPATPLNQARIRFCLSAAHSRAQLAACADALAAAARDLGLNYSRRAPPHSAR